ncbi:General transcription factor IIF subunit 2 [Porphyridium purpureum]|uniref:General transcription factor IIF subunit 2 n=1 Tax=Porphyridium purpureum TaxID=35688 RepID=A0A5J4Z9Y7_PORPP|nr:General transcription factor IIF subunit 2 [Porphyridium purpureum]|eukprot:POR4043..scf295_1
MEEVDEETRLSNPDEYTLTGTVDCSFAGREVYVMKVPLLLLQQCEKYARRDASAAAPGATKPPPVVAELRLPASTVAGEGRDSNGKAETTGHAGAGASTASAPPMGSLVFDRKLLNQSNVPVSSPADTEAAHDSKLSSLGATSRVAGTNRVPSVPLQYNVKFKPEKPKMLVFSDDPADDTGKVRLEGRVVHECIVQAQQATELARVKKAMEEEATKRRRVMEVLEEEEYRRTQMEELQARGITESFKSRDEKRRRAELLKRGSAAPMDDKWRETMLQKIFKAFESHSYWATEAILNECNESKQRLTPIIKELCVYNNRGPYAGTWELKDEFKTQQQRTDKDIDSAERRRRTIENVQLKLKEKEEREGKE